MKSIYESRIENALKEVSHVKLGINGLTPKEKQRQKLVKSLNEERAARQAAPSQTF